MPTPAAELTFFELAAPVRLLGGLLSVYRPPCGGDLELDANGFGVIDTTEALNCGGNECLDWTFGVVAKCSRSDVLAIVDGEDSVRSWRGDIAEC